MNEAKDLDAFASISIGARFMNDAGIEYVYLPQLKIHSAGQVCTLNALLCPAQHGGYTTRLFLSEPIPNKGNNWSVHTILSRTWHTWSWNNVPANLKLVQILSAHLRALK